MGERWYLDGVSLSQLEELVLTGRKGTSDTVRGQRREGRQKQAHSPSRGHDGHLVPEAVSGSHNLCLYFRVHHIHP